MKRSKLGLAKRIVSVVLAVAMIATSVSVAAPEVQAAPKDSTMGTSEVLSATHVKDAKVLQFYRILANMVKEEGGENAAIAVGDKDAQTVIDEYAATYDDASALGSYLTEYPGKIDFGTMSIQYVEGIGWARSAKEIDLSQANFSTTLTKVPDSEFALCVNLEKIVLPSTVSEIGNNAFESCQALKTLSIGSGEDGVIDLTQVDVVGASAFSVCTSITDVTFSPYGTRSQELKMGEKAFAGCSSLEAIEIPIKTAANLGSNAFENCTSLCEVGLQDELGYINNAVFQSTGGQTGLEFYIIDDVDNTVNRLPKEITYIGDYAFKSAILQPMDLSECKKLKSLNKYSFSASVLPELLLPDSLEKIETMTFNVTLIPELEIPENCVTIEKQAFKKSSIVKIQLPKGLETIEESTFEECENLDGNRIVIPAGSALQTIKANAFKTCKSLNTTEFLMNCNNLTEIGESAFANCYEVTKIGTRVLSNIYGDRQVISGLRTIKLPDSVVSLGASVFADDYALRSAELGKGIVNIPEKAFYNSIAAKSGAGLERVIVSNKLESVGTSAFENQSRLTTVGYTDGSQIVEKEGTIQFNDGLLSIGDAAFSGCGTESTMTVAGLEVKYVDASKIYEEDSDACSEFIIYDYMNLDRVNNYCKTVYIDENDMLTVDDLSAEDYNAESGKLTSAGEEKYKPVHVIAKKLYIDEDVFTDVQKDSNKANCIETYDNYDSASECYKDCLFAERGSVNTCNKLYCEADVLETAVSVNPEPGRVGVWSKPVTGCTIENVAIDRNKIATRNYTVNYAFGVRNVRIPDTVIEDKLGQKAFMNCINLCDVKLSEKLTEIKDSTFSGAGKEVTNFLGTGDAFKLYDYYGLKTINIPDGIVNIGKEAFKSCYNLNLKKQGGSSFGRNLNKIGDSAFANCYSLTEVHFPDTLEEIGANAFASCSVQYKDPVEIPYETTGKYSFYVNMPEYGTKEIKSGLTVINFTGALSLKTIGNGAFSKTNVKDVSLIKSPLVNIPDNLFMQCSYLTTIAFQDKTESLGSNVLKDTINLSGVTLPASSTMKENTISGAFGLLWGDTDPTLTLSYDKEQVITIAHGSSARLPINAINKDTLNGDIKISVDTGNGQFTSIKEKEVNGLYATCVLESNGVYSVSLEGRGYVDDVVTVRVECATRFNYAESSSYWIAPHSFEFKVKVQEKPTEKITATAAEDASVIKNPKMYVEGTEKILYIPATEESAKNGVKLSAAIEPIDTTQDVVWASDSASMVVSDSVYEKGSGVSTAIVKPQVDADGNPQLGSAKITVTSGEVKDTIMVYTVIPVTSVDRIVCTTEGTNLGATLNANSSANPFMLDLGTQEKIDVSLDMSNTNYSEAQISEYGEKYVFESSNPEVIEVQSDGTIFAKGEGEATVTVTGQASGVKKTFYFKIEDGYIPSPEKIEVSGPTQVNVGETITLSASVTPDKAAKDVTWSVTARTASVASVDQNGNVTGLSKGTAKIVATSTVKNNIKSQEYEVVVLAPATEFRMLSGDVTLEKGKTMKISKSSNSASSTGYYLYPVDTTDTITWTSGTPSIFTVESATSSVTIKAVSNGTGVLHGKTSSGLEVKLNVNVIEKATGIAVDTTETTLNVGETFQINVKKMPETATEALTYKYTTSNAQIAQVSESGLVNAIAPGTATITVQSNTGKRAICRIVVKAPVKKITVLVNKPNAKKIYMAKGETVSLKAKLTPENTTDTLTYKSSKNKVATVMNNGIVSAKKKGKAKITITATSGKKATVTVIVSKKPVKAKKVKVKCAKKLKRNKTLKLNVSFKVKKSTDTLAFSSSNPNIATVDAYGYVTAKNKKGKVKITVTSSSGKKATKTIKVK